jgi:hypothetical protein
VTVCAQTARARVCEAGYRQGGLNALLRQHHPGEGVSSHTLCGIALALLVGNATLVVADMSPCSLHPPYMCAHLPQEEGNRRAQARGVQSRYDSMVTCAHLVVVQASLSC